MRRSGTPKRVVMSTSCAYATVSSRFGVVAVVWFEMNRGPRVRRVFLPDADEPVERRVRTVFTGAVARWSPEIARHLRCPRAARAVGRALATNPFPIIVPCHRAIATNGGLGGYQAGLGMKRALLELEGVEFDERGRVRAARMCY